MIVPAQTFPPLVDLGRVPPGPVLVVAPHPDDEICGCGGAIVLHLRRGDPVHVALVTLGERGGSSSTRLAESRAAAAVLGQVAASCLGSADGAVAQDASLGRRLGTLVAQVDPVVVYAPSPFEMHPDHVASLAATAEALADRPGTTLLLYEVNTECMASFLLDVTPVVDVKRRALEAFASQRQVLDIVEKVDARNRARTVNVDVRGVTHAEAYLELPAARVAEVSRRLCRLADLLGLCR